MRGGQTNTLRPYHSRPPIPVISLISELELCFLLSNTTRQVETAVKSSFIRLLIRFVFCYFAGHSGLELFVKQSGPSVWPKTCPIGYSQHLGAIEEDCEINFCVKSNIFNSQGFLIIKRPPYSNAPKIYKYTVPLLVVNNDTGQIWSKRSNSTLWVLATKRWVKGMSFSEQSQYWVEYYMVETYCQWQ